MLAPSNGAPLLFVLVVCFQDCDRAQRRSFYFPGFQHPIQSKHKIQVKIVVVPGTMVNTSFIAVRDDARVISNNEREFIKNSVRLDGRNASDIRNLSIELTRDENLAAATILWGSRVSTSVSATLTAPTERPNEGSLVISVDFSPGASTSFRQATPAGVGTRGGAASNLPPADRHQRIASNHILRCLERSLSDALDVEALCVIPGRFVWSLEICTVVLDASGGNLLDSCMVSCFAALRHYRKPVLDTNEPVPRILPGSLKEPTPLPLHHTPFSISFAMIDGKTLVDPSHREELCSSGELTIVLNAHSEVCWLDFSGGCELDLTDLREANELVAQHVQTISKRFEETLRKADEEFSQLQLAKIQQQELPPLPEPNVPFFVEEPQPEIDNRASVETTEEEQYRRQALDYNLGHVSQKIRDDTIKNPNKHPPNTSQLLAAMLQSVQQQFEVGADKNSTDDGPSMESVDTEKQPPVVPALTEKTKDSPVAQKTAPSLSSMVVDSDEEEVTTQLQSEFQSVKKDDEDVADLAAAIKTKKKKKKKK